MATQNQNQIEIVIKAVDAMSADLIRVERQIGALQGATEKVSTGMGKALIPAGQLNSIFRVMAQHVAELGPASGLFARSLSQIAVGGLSAGLVVGGISVALSLLIEKIKQAREEAEKPFVFGGKDTLAQHRGILEMQRSLSLVIKLEQARENPARQITLQLEAQRQRLIDQFPISEQLINKQFDRLKIEKDITRERQEQLKQTAFLLKFLDFEHDLAEDMATAVNQITDALRKAADAGRESQGRMLEQIAMEDISKSDIEEVGNLEVIADIERQARERTQRLMEESDALLKARLEKLGLDARAFSQGIMAALEGGQKGLFDFMTRQGRRLAETLLESMLQEIIFSPLKAQLAQAMAALFKPTEGGKGGTGLGIFQRILGLAGGIGRFFGGGPGHGGIDIGGLPGVGEFAHGGMVAPRLDMTRLRGFQHGGVVEGPTLGVIGEEGPEIVARMKPARERDARRGGDEEVINIHVWDQRPKNLRPGDILVIVANDAERGGEVGKAMQNVIRRSK